MVRTAKNINQLRIINALFYVSISRDHRYFMEVVSKHSGGSGRDPLPREMEEGNQLLSPRGNGQPDSSPDGADPGGPIPVDGGNKAGGRSYQKVPSIATSALADAAEQQGGVAEESGGAGGAGGAQQANGDASRNEGSPHEFAMV